MPIGVVSLWLLESQILRIDQNKIKLKFGNFLVASNGQMFNRIDIKKLDALYER